MNRFYNNMVKTILALFAIIFTSSELYAQQQCAFSATYQGYATVGCGGSGNGYYVSSTGFINYNVVNGVNYDFSTCGTAWDSQLDIWTSGGGFLVGNDDNGPSCSGATASINWTSNTTTEVYAIVHNYPCGVGYLNFPSTSAILNLRQNTGVTNTTSGDICGGTKTLTANLTGANNSPTIDWSLVSGGGSVSGATYTASGYSGSVTVRATVGVCSSDASFVVNQFTTANAGPDQTVCGTTATLAGNTPTSGVGTWSLVSGTGSITSPNSPTSGITGLGLGANTFRWTLPNGVCADSQDDVIITGNQFVAATAGSDQAVCANTATVTGSTPLTGSGTWSLVSGTGTVISPTSPTTGLSGLGLGANTFRWTLLNGVCADSQDDVIITSDQFTAANAGADQSVCATTATLAGNAPATGIGTWALISGAGSITSPNSPSSGLTSLGAGVNTFRWTLPNGSCTDSQDDVSITRDDFTSAAAGTDQSVCAATATLTGNTPLTGSGTWTLVGGTGTIISPTSVSTGVSALGLGANTFRWTVLNGVCTDSQDDVVVTSDQLTTAAAGADQTVCASTATLSGNTPTSGSGTWTLVSGTGTITSPNSPTTGVTALGVGANTFRWTLLNGVCADSQDDVIITSDQLTTADAGTDQTVCGTTATLAGNSPSTGVGTWTLVSGTGTISSPNSPTFGLTGLGLGANTFRWTLPNGVCSDSQDDVVVTSDLFTTADAGLDQTVCASTATLAGNTPTTGGGTWTLVSGAGTIISPASPTTGVSGLGLGANTFRWTLPNGACADSQDDVVINSDELTNASAGSDQTVCGTTATLAGNAPATGVGTWTLVSGSGTITSANSPTSGLTGLGLGANVFRWTLPNGVCADSQDDVTITSDEFTTAVAGSDQSVCGTVATLAGNTPATSVGTWSLVSGSAGITTPTSPTSGLTAVGVGANTFRWTLLNGACADSQDDVVIIGDQFTTADAGSDQTVCSSTATILGNTPTSGVGTWTLVSGAGTITSPNTPTSGVTGLGLGTNTFRWTLPNGVCVDSQDDVDITSDQFTLAAAGLDQSVCATTATLAGNAPATGIGTWTLVSGTGTITSPNSPSSGLTGLGLGANTFRWTLLNGLCTDSQDDVVITSDEFTTADAGIDQIVCATSATLTGNTPITGLGTWTVVGGSGVITSPNSPSTTITSLGLGANTFRWTLLNGVCTDSQDDVVVTSDQFTTASAGPDETVCGTSAVLAANSPASGVGTWTLLSGTGTITSPNSPSSGITGLGLGANSFRWTLPNGVCADWEDDVIITSVPLPSVSASGDATICEGGTASLSASVAGGTGVCSLQWQDSPDDITYTNILGASASTYTTPVLSSSTYYRVQNTCTGSGCGTATSATVTITVTPDPIAPTITKSPNALEVCAGTVLSVNVSGGSDGTGTCVNEFRISNDNGGSWSAWSSTVPSITSIPGTTIIEAKRECDGVGCNSSVSSVSWIVNPIPVVVATPSSQFFCSGGTTSIALSTAPVVPSTTYSWTASGAVGTNGYSDDSGNSIAQQLFNTSGNPAIVSYTITPEALTCIGNDIVVQITVNPIPDVVASPATLELCDGSLATLNLTSAVTAAAFNWTVSGTAGTGGFTAGTGNTISQVLTNSTLALGTVTYTITPSGNGCTGSDLVYSVTVNNTPAVTFSPFGGPYCIGNSTPVSMVAFAIPAGGVFSGTGVSGDDFIPSLAAVGINTITYTYTDANSCVNTATTTVEVTGLPLVNFSGLAPGGYCVNSVTPVTLTGFPAGGVFSGPGISGNQFTPSAAGIGLHNVVYTYTDANSCSTSQTQAVNVFGLPVVSIFGLNSAYCLSESPVSVTGFPAGGVLSGTGITGNQFSPSTAGVGGPYTISYVYSDGSGCSNTATVDVSVSGVTSADAGTGGNQCDLDFQLGAIPSAGVGTWISVGPGSSSFSPNANDPAAIATVTTYGTYTFTWTEVNGQCSSFDQITVNFYEQPVADAGSGGSECDDNFDFGGTASIGTGLWTSTGPGLGAYLNINSPTTSVTVPEYGQYTFTWTETNGTCISSDAIVVDFYEQPIANAGLGGNSCTGQYTFSAVASSGVGTWTQVSGPGTTTYSDVNSATATATASQEGTYTYQWEEVEGTCSDNATVTVNYYNQPVADAGNGGDECDLTFVFNATPSSGTGAWTQTSGPGTTSYSDATSATATATASQYGTYTYRWTEVNGTCSDFAEITVNFYDQPVANAGTGGDECDLNFVFSAIPSVGTGVWTQTSGPGTSTYNNSSSAVATVTVSQYGTYTYTWTETNGTCSDNAVVTVNYYEQPVAEAGNGGSECDLTFDLSATPSFGTGVWTASGTGTATYGSASSAATTATVSQVGVYTFTWTETNGVCTSSDNAVVTFYNQTVAEAGTGGDACDLDFVLSAVPTFGTGTWSQTAGPGFASFTPNANTATATATVSQYGTYTFTWTEGDGVCVTTDQVTVNYYEQPIANAGLGGNSCTGQYTFSAVASSGVGTWTQVSGPGTTTYSDVNSATATATASQEGTYTYQWEEVEGTCSDNATVTVNYYNQPVADAGNGGDECDLTFVFNATPSSGTGAWTQTSGPGTTSYSDATSATATATASQYGTYTYRWTEVNGTCSDFAEITVNFYDQPVANAGTGGDECDLNFVFSAIPSVGTGVWTQTSGPGTSTYNNSSSAVATVTVSQYGTYTYTWTETNGTCSDNAVVTVNYYEQPVAEAGNGGSECDLTFDLSATPSFGTGVWTASGTGTATYGSASSAATTATVSQVGVYTFTWTETNGVCTSSDNAVVTFYNQTVAEAGTGGDACDLDFVLSAVPTFGTGTWSQTAGPGFASFTPNANTATATATVSQYGTYTFTWTEGDGVCVTTDQVTVNYYEQPIANAGLGGNSCTGQYTFSAVASSGVGTWTQVSGPGTTTYSDVNSATATATASQEGTYTYQWEEVEGTCSDNATVTVNYYNQPVADAGNGGDECDLTFVFNATPSSGTGAWTQTSGPGTTSYSDATSATATATASQYGTYTYRWTEVNGTCSDFAEITVNFYDQPVANAGTGGDECDLNFVFSAIPSVGTGVWTQTSGPGTSTYNNSSSAVATVTVSQYGTYTYTWTETNGTCSDNAVVTVNYYEQPVAEAGNGGSECDLTFDLSATPSFGTGVWTASGTGTATYGSASSAATTATVSQVGVYTFTWTETNGVCTSSDNAVVTFYNQTVAEAGTGGDACDLDFVLSAVPTFGTGTWSQTAGPGFASFTPNANTATATATVSQYGTYTFTWTEGDGVCVTTDQVTVNYYEQPIANAGLGGNSCTGQYTFSAVASSGVGTWTQVSGPGTTTYSDVNSATATATASQEGTYTYQWEEVEGTCSDNATVTVNYYNQPVADAGNGGDECDLTFVFNATPSSGTGAWTQTSGPGTTSYSDATSATATATASQYGTYTYRWTEVNGTCSDFAEITVNFYDQPVANAGTGGDECDLNFVFSAIPSVGTGVWTQTSGPGTSTYNNSSSAVATVTVSQYGTYTYTWTETNGTCSDNAVVTVNYYEQPVAEAGNGGSECDLTFDLSATPSFGTGVWTASGTGTATYGSASSAATTATVSQVGVYTFTWTETNGVCTSSDNAVVTFYNQTVAEAGTGGDACDLDFVLSAVPTFGTGTWSQTAGPGFASFTPNANTATATATVSQYGTYTFTWTEGDGVCVTTDQVTVNYYEQPIANAGLGGNSCTGQYTFSAVASSGVGTWTQVSGPGTTTYSDVNSATATATASQEGTYTYQWEEVEGTCSDNATVTVNYYNQPVADAGNGGDECDLTFVFNATPSSGTGAWTQTSGPGTTSYSDATSATATATASQYGTYTYRWTEVNGTCSDFAEITVNFYDQPVANAGTGGDECDLNFVFSAIPSVGTGVWTQTSGPGTSTYNNSSSAVATVTVSQYGTYTYTWTETNGTCSDNAVVTVNYYEQPVAEAGNGGSECDLTFDLSATPSFGTGVWTASGTGTATYGSASSAATTATVSQVGVYTFTWTETNGVCTSSDNAVVTFYNQTVAEAGTGGDACDLDFVLSAVPTFGTGTWSQTAGPGFASFTPNANTATATATVSQYGTYTFTWTEGDGVCVTTDQVTVNYYEQPIANAGLGGNSCTGQYTFSAVASSGVGTWTQVSGPGTTTYSDVNSATATATASQEGTYTYQWEEVEGTCSDNATVTVNYYNQPVADAGNGGDECDLTFVFNATPSSGTGAWTQTSGPGTTSYSDATSATATATASQYGTYTYRWTEVNGTCSDFAEITVNFYDQPVANAGTGGDECDLNFVFSAIPSVGTGVWTQTSGPGTSTYNNSSSAVATVTVSQYGTYTYTWTETNGTCSDNAVVTVNYYEQPVAEAGNGGSECDLTFDLSATPSFGTGVWTASGTGTATYGSASSAATTATVSQVGVYTFTWTETNGVCTSSDNAVVTFYNQTVAEAGTGGDACDLDFVLSAVPTFGTGTWSQTAGPGFASFTPNANTATATATVSQYGTYTFTWTEGDGVCVTTDQVTVNYYEQPIANAGLGGNSCTGQYTFSAVASSGVGTWTQVSGPGTTTYSDVNSATATATASQEGTYTYQWEEVEGTCSDNATVTVNYYNQPVADAGNGGDECDLTFVFNATPSSGTGAWTQTSGPGTTSYSDATSATATATASQYGTYTYRWTEQNGTCSDFAEITVNYYDQPVANAGTGGDECDLNFVFSAIPSVGTGVWTQTSGPGTSTYNNSSSAVATVTVSQYGTYTYTWTETNGTCSDNAVVTVNYYEQPVAEAGNGGSECDLTFDLSATPSFGTGVWTASWHRHSDLW
jgi:hypothetical protein